MDYNKNNVNRLTLFLPIETKAREMHGKVLLACVAAERGHKVFIGEMRELTKFVPYLPRGVYISKSIPEKVERQFRKYKAMGYGVCAWCEEGLVFRSREDYKREKVSEGALRHTDLFFTWGENQTVAVKEKAPEAGDALRIVGNPRIDLLRPPFNKIYKREVDELKRRYGDYILFNTTFSIANNILGTQKAFEDFKKRGKVKTEQDERRYWEFYEHKNALFHHMMGLVKSVSEAFPDKNIIIRPHPSEDHDTWRKVASSLNNVRVLFEGSATPWLMATDVVIHNGCTTAVEAHFLGTPAIAYRPVVNENQELELPNNVSLQAGTAEDVVAMIMEVSKRDEEYERLRQAATRELRAHIEDPEGPFSSERILDELEKFYASNPISSESPAVRWGRWAKDGVKNYLRGVRNIVRGEPIKKHSSSDKHRRQKLPDLSVAEIRLLIEDLSGVSGRFADVTASPLRRARNCFVVERKWPAGKDL